MAQLADPAGESCNLAGSSPLAIRFHSSQQTDSLAANSREKPAPWHRWSLPRLARSRLHNLTGRMPRPMPA
jgi:hypothetical protein